MMCFQRRTRSFLLAITLIITLGINLSIPSQVLAGTDKWHCVDNLILRIKNGTPFDMDLNIQSWPSRFGDIGMQQSNKHIQAGKEEIVEVPYHIIRITTNTSVAKESKMAGLSIQFEMDEIDYTYHLSEMAKVSS